MPPQKFGRYEIKSELGRGGMGTVFHAYDPRFQREVALKVLPRKFLHDPTFRARFEQEARTIGVLEHPAIVPVYDFGEEDHQPYLVMRYLPGGSLDERLQGQSLSVTEAIKILNHLAPALNEAHERGIVHRDLKPANILFDQRHMPYIADFGLVKLSSGGETITSGDVIVGTPAYMSPEQGNGDKIDGRTDVYALGVILFEMLTGILPYNSETPVGLLIKHLTEPIPNILKVKADLPPSCQRVIMQALAKNPDDRYSTATALATAFSQSIRAGSVSEPAVSAADAASYSSELEAKPSPPLPQQSALKPIITQLQELVCPNCGASLPGNIQPNQPVECNSCGSRFILSDSDINKTIVCPNCQTINPEEVPFCSNCDFRLQVDCVRCYTKNRVDATHCSNCGVNLESAQIRRRELEETRRRQQMEREKALLAKEERQRREKIEGLLKALEQPSQQDMAVYQLKQLGSEAVPGLINTLTGAKSPRARSGAAKTLGQIGEQHTIKALIKARIAKALIKALTDPEPAVRYWAAGAVGKFKGRPGQLAVEPLGALLKDRNDEVCQQARKSLQEIGGQRAHEILDQSKGIKGWLKGSS